MERTRFEASRWNRKAMHAIMCVMDENQYKLIQNTQIAKVAWDILQVAHEGTEVVKESKLQVLQTQFELLRIGEDECFNDFEIKLMDIVNQIDGYCKSKPSTRRPVFG